jgi:predicted unusual protein kinase regulating ubiquinone biosynthesis (AarF/ABC1/UbiB family)/nucleotide-binding universal stress UspA family protein
VVQRIVVATDRSVTAERAAAWAGEMAKRFAAELVLVEVIVPDAVDDVDADGQVSPADLEASLGELEQIARSVAGAAARARVVVHESPADAVVEVAREESADVIVVGNAGMSGNKKFLLSNVPNRITHAAHCTVITVNTALDGSKSSATVAAPMQPPVVDDDPMLSGRAAHIARVAAKHGFAELFARRKGDTSEEATRETAKRLRQALEELGPTFCKLGQILSTRPDLVPPAFIDELSQLRDNVPQLTEEQVVAVMEEELHVPWDDVFDSIEPTPLATGSIAQVHRATLATGERVVVKVQRPGARDEITRDLGLLGLFARRSASRPGLRQVMDPSVVVGHLSESLQRELDFRREAASIERMREILLPYPRLGVPAVYTDFSTDRLLVMEEIQGGPLSTAPEGPERSAAARELIESYYRQILTEGFFHADPHPGNLMWSDGVVYFLDFGMVGEVGPELREGLVLLLLAFWQEDEGFLADTLLMLSGDEPHPDLDLGQFQADLGELVVKYRHVPLRELQLGPMLQDVTSLAVRYEVPLPPTLVLTAKALAQIQHATAELDPDVDPFAVAGAYLAKSTLEKLRGVGRPQELLYQSQKLRVRFVRLFEALERLVGARPGPNLQVQFRGMEGIETSVRRASRRIALALTAAGAFIGTGITATSDTIASWVAPTFGAIAGFLTLVLLGDILRRNR